MVDTTQRCRTCKYWGSQSSMLHWNNVEKCCSPSVVNGHMPQDGEPRDFRLAISPVDPSLGPNMVGLVNWENVTMEMMTGPDFGCVHWEWKQ